MSEPFIFIGSYRVKHGATAWDWLDLDGSVQQVLGNPPKVLSGYAREFNEELDSYPTFVAGFTRTAAPVGVTG
jgi:hypothetical protein